MPNLTDEQVLALASRGLGARDIAHHLGVGEPAVHTAVARVRRRLDARSLDHAVQIHQTSKEQS
ncbi:LuxR C-terminal-related transcriptional regulator [Kitasatospora kifunensis]|uniref:DNA-binding CsgD family transcriptional regulator n=1 Tax=Kitasatospora kifunensis TaxID=58351 RepID=A0A7W7QYJ5_KITKI|nr:LuxR C-terminal-related transcriptional regulator [Kitasatospora kifunensis]MBB4922172.1 DNA-binding CsgD family transcriptional regulator [Kitasatospora kifunensis]